MFRLYREEVPGYNPVRFGRPYSTLDKACNIAARFAQSVFEVREVTPSGREILRDVVKGGHRVAAA